MYVRGEGRKGGGGRSPFSPASHLPAFSAGKRRRGMHPRFLPPTNLGEKEKERKVSIGQNMTYIIRRGIGNLHFRLKKEKRGEKGKGAAEIISFSEEKEGERNLPPLFLL